jgi:hypothetical protein
MPFRAAPRTHAAFSLTHARLAIAVVSVLCASAGLVSAEPARKFDFEFTNVADSTQGFTAFTTFPTINNSGAVGFIAAQNGIQGVFRSRNGEVTAIASASVKDGFQLFGNEPAINASGVVAFTAVTATGSVAIFTGDGQSRRLIADSAANGLSKNSIGAPSINAAGTVAFSARIIAPGLPMSIFAGNGGPLATLLTTSTAGFGAFANVDINDSGTIAFRGFLTDGTEGIFIGTSSPAPVVTTKTNPEINGFDEVVINNARTIAVIGFRTAGGLEVITGNTRGITLRNDPANPPFVNSDHPSINNHGAVAFFAIPFPDPNAPTGIFLEATGGHSVIPVIRPGDTLFGSTVTSVDLGRFALNDRFELVFQYSLSDGRSGIAIASFHGEREGDVEQE